MEKKKKLKTMKPL